MAGRPPRLTKELQDRIVAFVRIGGYPDVAARACGVPRRTFFEWMQRGRDTHPTRKPTPALVRFAEAVDQAVALAELHHVTRIYEFAHGTRGAAKSSMTLAQAVQSQWMLGRRFWERWGQRPATAMDVNDAPEPQSRAELEDMQPKITIICAPDPDFDAETEAAARRAEEHPLLEVHDKPGWGPHD